MSRPARRHYAVLKVICELILAKGFSPTLEEIGKEMGIKSKSNVLHYVRKLEDEELISRDGRRSRTIRPTGSAPFMRVPKKTEALREWKPRKVEKSRRSQYEAECFEKAVALGKARDAEIEKAKRDGVFHDNHPLFWNGVLRASKIG